METITYVDRADDIAPAQLHGFFEGWQNPPSPETHARILAGSDHVVLAIDERTGAVVGFITAITDGVLAASIPLLEVLPAFRSRGIGRELVRRLLAALEHLYMVDLMCDPDLQPFYASLGMQPMSGMAIRRYEAQAGAPEGGPRG